MPDPSGAVTFWINAFLPWYLPGLTCRVPVGPRAGKSALAGARWCLTDQRGPSRDPAARSRAHSLVTVRLDGSEVILDQRHRCDPTTVLDPGSGEVICERRASTGGLRFTLSGSGAVVTVALAGHVRNPCPEGYEAYQDVGYRGTLAFEPAAGRLSIDLMVGLYPAFEAYACWPGEPAVVLFHQFPPAGTSAASAPPAERRRIRAALHWPGGRLR